MQLGLINSAWAQAGQETVWGLQKTKEIGFDYVDLLVDPCEIDMRERRQIALECQRLELPIVSLCCVAVGLIDPFPSVRKFHLERVCKHLELAYEYQARNVLLVLGEYIWNREVVPPAEQWNHAVAQCQRIGDYAAQLGLEIALELEPFHLSLLNNVDAMVRFLDDVHHPAIRANIDISHLCLAKVSADELGKLRGRSAHVHISDCDGERHGDLPPGRGVVPFAPYLQQLGSLGLPGTISIELEYAPQPDQIESWVREAYTATAQLLRTQGLRR